MGEPGHRGDVDALSLNDRLQRQEIPMAESRSSQRQVWTYLLLVFLYTEESLAAEIRRA